MSPIRNALTLVVFASLAAGCSRPAPAPTAPGGPAADRGPKFESELVYTYSVGGGKGRGTDRSVRYDGDKPFVAVTNWKATQAGDGREGVRKAQAAGQPQLVDGMALGCLRGDHLPLEGVGSPLPDPLRWPALD